MARARIPEKLKRGKQLVIRVTPAEHAKIAREAKRAKLSKSDYGRSFIDGLS